jgi:CRISPR-associated protein Csm3
MDKLSKKIFIEGTIEALTGLHIGGTNNELSIGGMDNAVIKNPVTKKPYIPGSSLKGKMRSLLEISMGTLGTKPMGRDIKHPPTSNPHFLASRIFGYTQYKADKDPENKDSDGKLKYFPQQPSRVIVRDCNLMNEDSMGNQLIEEKAETVIDRITSAAMPRQMERVPAGAIFSMNIVINIFEKDNEKELVNGALDGLNLVMDDYLGGAGSRGSGQVKIAIEKMYEKDSAYYTKSDKPTSPPSVKDNYSGYLPNLFEV